MSFDSLILVTPAKPDRERDAIARVWLEGGGMVERLDRFWEPPGYLDREKIRLYGNEAFCLVLAKKFDLKLLSPDIRVLASAPDWLVRRHIRIVKLAAVQAGSFPLFAKPIVPKQFRAAVYNSKGELESECQGLGPETEILISDVVRIQAEARAFALDSVIRTVAIYEGNANHDQAAKFAERVLHALDLPRAVVLDVGLLEDCSWGFIEANAAWGAGLNGCDAKAAAICIAAATEAG